MSTAADLIKRAYYLAQVLDPSEEIDGFYAEEGLNELNKTLDLWGSLPMYIPSYTILTQATVAGTSSYNITPVITNLSEAHLVDSNNVQYEMFQVDLQRFNTFNYALSAASPTRPQFIFVQNDFVNYPTVTKLRVFPVPDAVYTITMYAMQRLSNVTYSQDMSALPPYVQAALEYELAKAFINIWSTTPAVTFKDDYEEVMKQMKAANIRDKSVQVGNEFRSYRRFRPWGTYVG